MSEETGCVFEKGQQVEPKVGFETQFREENRYCPMFVHDVRKGIASNSDTVWLRLVDEKGREIIGQRDSKLFNAFWVKRKNSRGSF